eukprot:c18189_g1_i2.p1 GENE.c18189_g1_i2~~c18189_g1_i2.p1  ORF type:complete len:152 (+),score=10.59 c18189_g1_i2:35-457(+)
MSLSGPVPLVQSLFEKLQTATSEAETLQICRRCMTIIRRVDAETIMQIANMMQVSSATPTLCQLTSPSHTPVVRQAAFGVLGRTFFHNHSFALACVSNDQMVNAMCIGLEDSDEVQRPSSPLLFRPRACSQHQILNHSVI